MSDTTYKRKEYTIDPEGDVAKALDALNSHITQNKPEVYGSEGAPAPWLAELSTVYDQIKTKTNNPFTYDFNGDALYQQYKDKYTQQAKMAMQDTMGQAAAMTGGYGNSYAATVGNQAYQATMQNLNDVIPELYQLAYDKHKNEVQELYNRYSLVSDRESKDYRNYRDGVIDYYSELDYLTGRYDSILGFDYGKHVDKENWAYDEHRDAVGDKQWLANFTGMFGDIKGLARQQYEDNKVSNSSGGGGNVNYNNGGNDNNEFHKATFSRTDEYGNNVFYIDGKEQTFAPGINPYTGSKNSDIKNGTFSNGYQPNNVNGQKLSKSGITDVVNGVTQNVWKTPDGTKWIWDGTQNKYLRYED